MQFQNPNRIFHIFCYSEYDQNGVSGQVPKTTGKYSNLNLSPQSLINTGSPLLGSASAPITIVEFGDFLVQIL